MTKHVLPGIFDESAEERRRRHHENIESSRMFASKRPERNVSREIPQLVPDKGTHGSSPSRYRFSSVLFSSSPARGDFWKSLSKSEDAADSLQNIGRIVCSRLTRSFPPLRGLFYPCWFFSPSIFHTTWKNLDSNEREKERENLRWRFSFLFFSFFFFPGSEWFTLCLLARQWRKGETIVRKVNSLITSEIGIDGADYHGGQRDREVAPFVRSSPPFNTFSTAIRSPIRGCCCCCNIQWAAVNNRFQCVHGNKPLPPFFFRSYSRLENGKNYRI